MTRTLALGLVLLAALAAPARAGDVAVQVLVDLDLSLSSEPDAARRGGHVERAAQRLEQNGHADLAARLRAKHGGGLPPGQRDDDADAAKAELTVRLCDLVVSVGLADDAAQRAERQNAVLEVLVAEADREGTEGRGERCVELAEQAGRVVELGIAVDVDRSVTDGLGDRVEPTLEVTARHVARLELVVSRAPAEAKVGLQRALEVCQRGRAKAAEKVKGAGNGNAGGSGNGIAGGSGNGNGNGNGSAGGNGNGNGNGNGSAGGNGNGNGNGNAGGNGNGNGNGNAGGNGNGNGNGRGRGRGGR